MNKKLVVISCVFFIASLSWSQNHQQKLADVFLEDGPNHTETSGYSFNGFYSNSGSFWQLDWPETYVFDKLIAYNDPSNPDKSYQMRLGKGGQIYSFKSAFGEALPPQYRRSYNEAGSALLDQPISNPVKSHYGNWAPWNDEVWQIVASDQIDELNGTKAAQNIHQAGPYMNNYNTRASDLTKEPFYSPLVQSYFDASNQSYTSVYWGQSEDPSYVYNPTNLSDPFRPSVLIYQRYKNLGDGVIQVDFMVFNYHRTRAIGYWSVPWAGIRNSSLPYAFIANNFNDVTSYETLSIPLPVFNDGVTRNVNQTGGWFAFSNASNGNGSSMAFVTAKESISGGYSDYRWGTALGTGNIRDATIFSKRHIPGTSNKWELVGGEGIRGRYFLVVDSSIDAIVNQIKTRNLVKASSVELFTFTEKDLTNINYNFSANPSGNYSVIETNSSNAYLSVKPKPFLGSYPAYLLSTATESRITANPYYYSLKPYDGSVKSIKLLGFTTTALDLNPATACANTWYLDADGDNFAIATVVSCNSPGSGYTTSVLPITDCDDNNANINPSASDVLDNGIDENCDGEDASSFDIWHEIKQCYQLPITTIQSIYTASVTNPNTSGINSNATVSKMEKNGAGAARIKLNNPITDTSSLNISLQLLATEAGSNGIGSGFFRIQLQTLKTSPATTTLVASLAVSSANTWEFKNIDLSGIVIPKAVIDAGGYEYLYIVSGATAPGASIFYFDKIKSNLTQGISSASPELLADNSWIYNYGSNDFNAGLSTINVTHTNSATSPSLIGNNASNVLKVERGDNASCYSIFNLSGILSSPYNVNQKIKCRIFADCNLASTGKINLVLRNSSQGANGEKKSPTLQISQNKWIEVEMSLLDFSIGQSIGDLSFYDQIGILYNSGDLIGSPASGNIYFIDALQASNSALLSVNEFNMNQRLILFPNPANDKFTLSREIDHAKIFNIDGKMINTIKKTNTFDVSNFAKGVYFIEAFYNDIKQTLKFIVK